MNTALIADSTHSKALPDLVAKLLTVRQESLVLYHKLAVLKPSTPAGPAQHLLQRFRQTLMDYLALGPFEVYQALEDQPADSPYRPARDLARRLYARIARTTQTALAFHDRYDGELSDPALADLNQDLSRLGESLATRIELEDRIVAAVRHQSATFAA
ncbi:MAG: Rsd/AlgQ family anti-sigma factor [Candidatus Contendobacter sp.]|jgi:regulator of sigma D|nr:Rsd/AlgQ family anti-sigma factor [Gammaproteobacteria bacterium]MCC8994687.1 Rsd/AlgQ family anti-sigma factor [Candidatus Contendobacter sp.]